MSLMPPTRKVRARPGGFVASRQGLRAASRPPRRGDRGDMRGRGAAAAADDIDQPFLGPATDHAGGRLGRLVIFAELVGQARIGIGQDQRIGDRAPAVARAGAIVSAPNVQLSPTASGRAWRTAYQKASTVWPDRLRPDRSVIVIDSMIGMSRPHRCAILRRAWTAALALSVSKIVSTRMKSAPPSTSASACSR